MTVQQLKYIIVTAEKGSITEAAKALYLSQPSLSGAIKDVEKAAGITVFNRCHTGVVPTKEGLEFLGYARQVLQQMELLEAKYMGSEAPKQRFCVSTQHYTFTTNAFVELLQRFGQERYEFILNETQTHQILEDVRNRYCDLGILFLSQSNEAVLRKVFDEYDLEFYELFPALPHIFIRRGHPLSQRTQVALQDLAPYPRLNFVQGIYESSNFSEELFSSEPSKKVIRVSDRAAIVNLMLGLDGYTISSGIFPSFLQGDEIVSIPIDTPEEMRIGYVLNRGQLLSELGQLYVEMLEQYNPQPTQSIVYSYKSSSVFNITYHMTIHGTLLKKEVSAMPSHIIGNFFMYAIINAFTPGPGNILAMNTVTNYGWRRGNPLFLGIFAGYYVVQFICAVFVYGVSAFLPNVLSVMKYAGAAYIFWLAVHIAVSKPAENSQEHSASFFRGFLLQLVNIKIYLFGITALTGYVTDYSTSLWVLLLFESIIATIGTAATLSWIGAGMLIQHIYSKHRQIINIILALALLECVFSILTV